MTNQESKTKPVPVELSQAKKRLAKAVDKLASGWFQNWESVEIEKGLLQTSQATVYPQGNEVGGPEADGTGISHVRAIIGRQVYRQFPAVDDSLELLVTLGSNEGERIRKISLTGMGFGFNVSGVFGSGKEPVSDQEAIDVLTRTGNLFDNIRSRERALRQLEKDFNDQLGRVVGLIKPGKEIFAHGGIKYLIEFPEHHVISKMGLNLDQDRNDQTKPDYYAALVVESQGMEPRSWEAVAEISFPRFRGWQFEFHSLKPIHSVDPDSMAILNTGPVGPVDTVAKSNVLGRITDTLRQVTPDNIR